MANADQNCFLDHDQLSLDEFSDIDIKLLMSLIQDSQVEEDVNGDDQKMFMIQSLEQPQVSMDPDSCSCSSDDQDLRFCDADQTESCSSASPHHCLDHFERLELETMAYDYDYPSDGYFNGNDFTGKMESMVEGLEGYSLVSYGMVMEEDDDHYIGLWQ